MKTSKKKRSKSVKVFGGKESMKAQNRVSTGTIPKDSGYKIKSIPSYYRGIKFRSQLEANYAVFFDEYGIEWEYEVEGYDLDGLWYLPDFWLPEIKTFFEVKGILKNIEKPKRLAEALKVDDEFFPKILVIIGDNHGRVFSPLSPDSPISMAKCANCGKYWFYFEEGSWECRACGEHQGDHHLRNVYTGTDLSSLIKSFVESKR